MPSPQTLALAAITADLMDWGYAFLAGAAATRMKSFRRAGGAVHIALGPAAALTGGRR